MGTFFCCLCIGIVICISFIIIRNKNIDNIEVVKNEIGFCANIKYNSFPMVQIVENKLIEPDEKNKIVDSNIKHALSVIDNSVANTVITGKNIENATNFLNLDRKFFSTAKNGTENMMKVKGSAEVYGTQMVNNKFSKQTKFLDETNAIKSSGKNAIMNASFSAVSMVVGQYYMNEINNKLDIIQGDIKEISDFLDTEYQSNIEQIVSKMKEIIENQAEILDNDYSRNKRYDEVLNLESSCSKLLGQANGMIKRYIKNTDIEYKKYEEQSQKINKWLFRQQLLQKLLLEIGNLRYVLAYGNETYKLSHTQFNNYLEQINSVDSELESWHKIINKKLGINLIESRRNGKFFNIKKNTIGIINKNWAYKKVEKNIVEMINKQSNIKKLKPCLNEKQDNVIKIQKYKGEYYNLLNE